MVSLRTRITLAAFALIAFGGIALGQSGFWSNWPIVGGASYSCGSVNAVSNCTVAAGPTVITGAENIPGNTNLSGGRSPQNVLFSMASLNLLPYEYKLVALNTASYTYTLPNTTGTLILDVATGAITAATITAPAAPVDGQTVAISSAKTVTTFAFVANSGQTLAATTPTVLTASTTVPQGYKWLYRATDLKWYKIQ